MFKEKKEELDALRKELETQIKQAKQARSTYERREKYVTLKPFDVELDINGVVTGEGGFLKQLSAINSNQAWQFFMYCTREALMRKMQYTTRDNRDELVGMITAIDSVVVHLQDLSQKFIDLEKEKEETKEGDE